MVTQLGTRLVLGNSSILASGGRRAPSLHLHPSSQGTGDLHLKAQNMSRGGEGGQTLTPAEPRTDPHSRLVPPLPHWPHSHRLRVASACHTDHAQTPRSCPFRTPRWPTHSGPASKLTTPTHSALRCVATPPHTPGQPVPSPPPPHWSRPHTLTPAGSPHTGHTPTHTGPTPGSTGEALAFTD